MTRPRNAGLVFYEGQPLTDDDGQPIPPTWEPIVDAETYRTVLAILRNPDRRMKKQHEPKYLSASLAACGVCGSPLRAALNHGRPVYRCATHDGYGAKIEGMRHVSIAGAQLDKIITEAVVSAVLFAPIGKIADTDADRHRALHVRLAHIRQAVANLLDLVESRTFTPQEIAGKKRALDTEANEVEAEMANIAQRNARAALVTTARAELWSGKTVSLDTATRVKAEIRERFGMLDLEQKRTLVRGMLEVTVQPGRGVGRVEVSHLVATTLDGRALGYGWEPEVMEA